MLNWHEKPKPIASCPQSIDYLLFVDENGDSNLKYTKKCIKLGKSPDKCNILFTLTGVIVNKHDLSSISSEIMKIKNDYWEDGLYEYKSKTKRVCFHSREIRKGKGPFVFDSNSDESDFIYDLSNFMDSLNIKIISANINKYNLCKKYYTPFHPYHISAQFILERFYLYLSQKDATGAIILEARGKKEDSKLLKNIVNVLNNGAGSGGKPYISSYSLKNHIKGVYFNTKWSSQHDDLKSYFGLEIADLVSYPIHKYVRNSFNADKAFELIESKIENYPSILGHGLKIFP